MQSYRRIFNPKRLRRVRGPYRPKPYPNQGWDLGRQICSKQQKRSVHWGVAVAGSAAGADAAEFVVVDGVVVADVADVDGGEFVVVVAVVVDGVAVAVGAVEDVAAAVAGAC